jgi:hypothetical protein
LLSTLTTSTTGTKKLTIIMAPSACNQVTSDGSDLEGIRILFQDHLIPEFIPLSKVIQVNYNGVIDDITVVDPLFFDTSIKDKLTLTALDDLKDIIADLVVNRIPVMAPILAPILGVHFLGEHIKWDLLPPL